MVDKGILTEPMMVIKNIVKEGKGEQAQSENMSLIYTGDRFLSLLFTS